MSEKIFKPEIKRKEVSPDKYKIPEPGEYPGDLYVGGIKRLAEKNNISFKEAYDVLYEDLVETQGDEHMRATKNALEWLLKNEGEYPKKEKEE